MAEASLPVLSDPGCNIVSGMVAGFVVKVFDYPLDTVKVLQQTAGAKYRNAWDCVRQRYQSGGVAAFYRGLPSPLLGSMAECSVLFFAYGSMKDLLRVDEAASSLANPVPIWKYCVSGAASGCCSAFVLTPVELVKCRLQVQADSGAGLMGAARQGPRYKGVLDCVAHILRQEGPAGMWRGQAGCLAREVPGNIAWFGTYEIAVRGIQVARGYNRKADVPLAWKALAGASAGVAYWLVPFPADTVKSKLQTDPAFANRPFLEVFGAVLRKEGVRGLYRGVGIACAKAAPASALLFCVYEVVAAKLRRPEA